MNCKTCQVETQLLGDHGECVDCEDKREGPWVNPSRDDDGEQLPRRRTLRLTKQQRDHVESHISECAGKLFEWGKWDCALFVADVVREITTKYDPGKQWRGKYTSEQGIELTGTGIAGLPEACGLTRCEPFNGAIAVCVRGTLTFLGLLWQGRVLSPVHGQRGLTEWPAKTIQSTWSCLRR